MKVPPSTPLGLYNSLLRQDFYLWANSDQKINEKMCDATAYV